MLEAVRMLRKILLTGLALVPLFVIFVYPNTTPGDTTLQHRADLVRLPMANLASILLALLLLLVTVTDWHSERLHVKASVKHRLLDLTCVRLC
jgi:hypothetical protein